MGDSSPGLKSSWLAGGVRYRGNYRGPPFSITAISQLRNSIVSSG